MIRGSIELDSVMIYGSEISEVINLHKELQESQTEIIYAMGEIGETRLKETRLMFASPMHDIGKVGIPDSVIKKPGKLTEDEFEIMKTHAVIGFNLLNHSHRLVLKAAAIIAYQHHEKWNGTDYPLQLEGKAIHIYRRITAIADALGSARTYKKEWRLKNSGVI